VLFSEASLRRALNEFVVHYHAAIRIESVMPKDSRRLNGIDHLQGQPQMCGELLILPRTFAVRDE